MVFRLDRNPTRGRSDFAAAVAHAPAGPPMLPFLLLLDGDRLRLAVEEDQITPPAFEPAPTPATASAQAEGAAGAPDAGSGCRLTLAYGRLDAPSCPKAPSFWSDGPQHSRGQGGSMGAPALPAWPVLLVFHPRILAGGGALYPFSPEAWAAGRLDPGLLRTDSLEGFDLSGVPAAPARLIRALYRTNLNFLNAHAVPDRRYLRKRRFALDGYAAWLQEAEVAREPELATPRLCFDQPLPLAQNLLVAMLPSMLLSDRIIADYLLGAGVAVRTYPHLGGAGPATRQPLQALYMDYLQARGLLGHGR